MAKQCNGMVWLWDVRFAKLEWKGNFSKIENQYLASFKKLPPTVIHCTWYKCAEFSSRETFLEQFNVMNNIYFHCSSGKGVCSHSFNVNVNCCLAMREFCIVNLYHLVFGILLYTFISSVISCATVKEHIHSTCNTNDCSVWGNLPRKSKS